MPANLAGTAASRHDKEMDRHLLLIGLGYSGTAIARAATAAGWHVTATARNPADATPPEAVTLIPLDAAGPAIAAATHLAVTAPPHWWSRWGRR